ncbi:hypothetical protein EOM09_03560 [bacterium]|nr:hypothetical protein [bacterium]
MKKNEKKIIKIMNTPLGMYIRTKVEDFNQKLKEYSEIRERFGIEKYEIIKIKLINETWK